MRSLMNLTMVLFTASALAIAATGQQSSTPSQQQGMSGMQGQRGTMSRSMQDCHKNMQSMLQTNEKARQDIAAARQSNDPAKLRAALDEADKALAGMNEHIQMCQPMMQHMQGTGGMMSDQQKTSGKQTTPKQ